METPKLNTLKKELQHLSIQELTAHLTRLAKYKVENKEFLNFLLFYQHDTDQYINEIKGIVTETFDELPYSDYSKIKPLRKLVRIINKHLKFVSDKKQDAEKLIILRHKYKEKHNKRTKQKALQIKFIRQFVRSQKSIEKLDEDLQFDYNKEMESLLQKIKEHKISLD
ncbi:hypothetical protein [Pseudopedobacter sp.]|uniref:hypothetical protein n=1 Tax=Pseudopedobacter sp. TaxID=1936787 RepID=UPI003341DEC0